MGWSLIDFTADLTGRGSEPSSTPTHRSHTADIDSERHGQSEHFTVYITRITTVVLVGLQPCMRYSEIKLY